MFQVPFLKSRMHDKLHQGGVSLLTSMEWASLEVQRFPCRFADALLSSAQRPEVFSSLGSDVRKKLQDYSASYGQTKMQIDEHTKEYSEKMTVDIGN